MPIPASPKVVFEEIDKSREAGSGTPYNLLIAGTSPKGTLKPQIRFSPADFVNTYGADADSNFYWAGSIITQFGSVLAVRVVGANARCSAISFNVDTGASGEAPTSVLAGVADPRKAAQITGTDVLFNIYAENPGTWGQTDIKVAVLTFADYSTSSFRVANPPMNADEFLVVVTTFSGTLLEYFRVSRNPNAKDSYGSIYIEDRINDNSQYIWVQDNKNVPLTALPMSTLSGVGLSPVALSGGVDDNNPTDGEIIQGYQKCRNTAQYDFAGILSIGNVGTSKNLTIPTALISLAEEVRTRLFLDNPFEIETPLEMIDYRDNKLNCSSNRVLMYFDWQQAYDAILDKSRYLPPTIFVGAAIAYMVNPNSGGGGKLYNSPAGSDFGKIWNATAARYDCNELERDNLYSHQINPLSTIAGLGRLIWGDKTQQKYRSSLSYYGPRTALDIIETEIKRVGQSILFKPNNRTTRNMFAAAVNPFLRAMYEEGALATPATLNVSDEIQKSAEVLNAILKVDLTEPVEGITVQVQVIQGQSVVISEL